MVVHIQCIDGVHIRIAQNKVKNLGENKKNDEEGGTFFIDIPYFLN